MERIVALVGSGMMFVGLIWGILLPSLGLTVSVVYLNEYGFTPAQISKWVDYAESTVKTYIRKFADLLEKAKKVFYHVTKKVKKVLVGGRQLVYLFKFYDGQNELICSKVGTTTQLPEQRLAQEIKYYREHGIPVERTEICSVIDCGTIPAEGAESITRAAFIRKYPDAFKKNDRFFGIDIPAVTFNRIVKNYLAEQIAY